MFAFLLLSIAASTLAQTPSLLIDNGSCGYQHSDDYTHPDSVDTALPDEFPWVAALIYQHPDGTKSMLCTGALIAPKYVVTVAQCMSLSESTLIAVRLGEYSTKNKTDCYMQEGISVCFDAVDLGIDEKIVHPQYNMKTKNNDIALLRLDRAVDFTDYIRPICVNKSPSLSQPGDRIYISGFGGEGAWADPVDLKKKIAATVVGQDKCQEKYPDSPIRDTQICSQDLSVNTLFTCTADAGAPVMFALGQPPRWHLEGLVSWGSGCGPDVVMLHTRVSPYADWIKENLV